MSAEQASASKKYRLPTDGTNAVVVRIFMALMKGPKTNAEIGKEIGDSSGTAKHVNRWTSRLIYAKPFNPIYIERWVVGPRGHWSARFSLNLDCVPKSNEPRPEVTRSAERYRRIALEKKKRKEARLALEAELEKKKKYNELGAVVIDTDEVLTRVPNSIFQLGQLG